MKALKNFLGVVFLGAVVIGYACAICAFYPGVTPQTPMGFLKFFGVFAGGVITAILLYGIWLDYILPEIDKYYLAKKLK